MSSLPPRYLDQHLRCIFLPNRHNQRPGLISEELAWMMFETPFWHKGPCLIIVAATPWIWNSGVTRVRDDLLKLLKEYTKELVWERPQHKPDESHIQAYIVLLIEPDRRYHLVRYDSFYRRLLWEPIFCLDPGGQAGSQQALQLMFARAAMIGVEAIDRYMELDELSRFR